MDTERVKAWLQEPPIPDGTAQIERALQAASARKPAVGDAHPYLRLAPALALLPIIGLAALFLPRPSSNPVTTLTKSVKTVSEEGKPSSEKVRAIVDKVKTNSTEVKATIDEIKTNTVKVKTPMKEIKTILKSVTTAQNLPMMDDLDDINADASAIQARWTAKSLTEEVEKASEVGAKSDNEFIQVPVPQLASSASPAEALKAWETQKQIVDARLQQRVTVGEKGISLTDLCETLTKETGVRFKCSRSVADDKITVFCKNRTLRDIMRQVNRIFGYVWDRIGTEPDFEYRLSQPVKNQLVEEELRNKDRNQKAIVWLGRALRGEKLDLNAADETGLYQIDVKLGEFQPNETNRRITVKALEGQDIVVTSENVAWSDINTVLGHYSRAAIRMTVDPSGLTDGLVAPENEKNNEKLKEFALFQQKVTIEPKPTLEKEKLCTSGDVLEAIHKATGKDVMGDYFTHLMPLEPLKQNDKTLFDALNAIGHVTHHRWDWERASVSGESDWLQFRTAGYYNARIREVPNRLLSRWQRARQEKKALDAADLGEIGLLTDAMLDSGAMGQGAQLLWGLSEWPTVAGSLRPHWRAFGRLSPERQQQALSEGGIGFRQLKLDNQQELFRLLSPQKRPSEFTLTGDLSAEDFWRAQLFVRFPAPPGEPIFSYRRLGREPQFWRWDVSESAEKTAIEPPGVADRED